MPTNTTTARVVETTINDNCRLASVEVNPADWFKYLRLKAEAKVLENQVKALEQSFNLPDPTELAASYGASQGDKLTVAIVNGNGDHMGKLSVYWFPGCTMPEGWRKRIS